MARDLTTLLGPAGGGPPGPRSALVTMELQRGVVGDLSPLPTLAQAAADAGVVVHSARLAAAARSVGLPVVHCTVSFRADRAGTTANTPLLQALLADPAHLLEGSPAAELVPELGAQPTDLVCRRHHGVSPFLGTDLDATLRSAGVRVLVAAGVSINLGILGLCIEAANLGYQVVLPTDAVAGVPASYAADVLRHTLALIATLTTTGEVLASWAARAGP